MSHLRQACQDYDLLGHCILRNAKKILVTRQGSFVLFGFSVIAGSLTGNGLEHPVKVGNAVEIQKLTDLLVTDISALKQLASLLNFQLIDVLHRRKAGQLSESSAINALTEGAPLCQLRNTELLCEMAADVTDATIILLRNGK